MPPMSIATPRRVVITGLGLISPLGNTIESFWDALISGRSGVQAVETSAGRPAADAVGGGSPPIHRGH